MNTLDRAVYNPQEIIQNKNFLLIKKKPEVKKTDMDDALLAVCLEKVSNYVEKFLTEGMDPQMDVASRFIKEEMDKTNGPTWTCIIGEAFAFNVKSQKEAFLYCYMGEYGILLYKC